MARNSAPRFASPSGVHASSRLGLGGIGREAHLCKAGAYRSVGVPFGRSVSQATQAVFFNAVPLLLLAAAYAAVTGAILPLLWRERDSAHPLDWAVVLVFPGIAIAAGIFGGLVLY